MQKKLVTIFIITLAIGFGTGLSALCPQANGADFPNPKKTIKLIAASAVGGGEDTEARGLAPFLQKYLGVTVSADNWVGAGGKIAFEKIQRAEPDGYNIILFSFPKSIIIEYMGKTKYMTKDFTPIYAWSRLNQVLVVNAETWKTFDDFLKAAKAKPLSGGLMGRGSTTHLAGLLAMDELGIKVNWVPYEGAGDALAALAGKHIDFMIGLSTSAVSLIDAGKLRALAMFNDERDPYMPDVPTAKDLGYDIKSIQALRCAMAPPRTPPAIVNVLEEAFSKSIKDPAFIEWAKKRKNVLGPLGSKELGKLVHEYYPYVEKYQNLLKE
jgi:tripartite-type tricarboxylate transporter receptor subunit TctC